MAEAIGSVFVSMGMDSADFDRGAKSVADSMAKLQKDISRLKDGFENLRNTAAVAAGLAVIRYAVDKVTSGFSEAMNSIGDMVDMSQRLGVPVEQLQGLSHAADLSGTSIENVGKSMAKLAQNMAAIAGGEDSGKAAATLQSLGISATDAAGQLRATDEVMIEMADKFASMEDGAAKTAAAMAVFGKSGAELIPMLNLGSAELRKTKEEAEKMGFVLEGKVASGLESLGDQWATIGKVIKGFWLQLSGQLLPVFQLFTDKILEWINTSGGAKAWAKSVGDALKTVAEWAISTAAAFSRLRENMVAAGSAFGNFFKGNWSQIASDNEEAANRIREINEKLKSDIDAIWTAPADVGGGGDGGAAPAKPGVPVANLNAAAEAKAAEVEQQKLHNAELERFNQLREEGKGLYEQTLDPLQKLSDEMERANELNRKGALLAHEHAAIQQRLAMQTLNAYSGMASGIMNNLSKVFGESKAFAIAQAIINTAESVTKTLATYGFTPWGIALAASAAAAGLAEIATIRSAGKGGGGGGGSSSVSSSAAGSAGGTSGGGAPAQQQGVYINLQSSRYSREEIIGLIDQINDASRDGARLMVQAA